MKQQKVLRFVKVRDPLEFKHWGDMKTIVRIFDRNEDKRLRVKTRMSNSYHEQKLNRFYCTRVQIPNT